MVLLTEDVEAWKPLWKCHLYLKNGKSVPSTNVSVPTNRSTFSTEKFAHGKKQQ